MADFVWFVSEEGLFSHLCQLQGVYETVVVQNNRTLILTAFKSNHYVDVGWINLCEVFDFKLPGLSCTSSFPDYYVSHYLNSRTCVSQKGLDWSHPREFKEFESSIIIVSNVELPSISCLVGSLFKRGAPFIYPRFHQRYRQSFLVLKDSLGFADQSSYVVVHWRREDQLWTRCKGFGVLDTSWNCKSVDEFSVRLRKLADEYNLRPPQIYIATNENNSSIISILRDQGFKTNQNLDRKLSSLESIIFESQLMIASELFFVSGKPGVSIIHNQISIARKFDGKQGAILID